MKNAAMSSVAVPLSPGRHLVVRFYNLMEISSRSFSPFTPTPRASWPICGIKCNTMQQSLEEMGESMV